MKSSQKGNIYIWVLVVVVILAVAAWYFYKAQPTAAPSAVTPSSDNDTTSNILKDINTVDSSDGLKTDINNGLDADINSL